VRSQEEITRFAANWLDQRYGKRMRVEFHDLNDPAVVESLGDLRPTVDVKRARLPIVTINGEVVRIEWFSAWSLIDAVEDYLNAHKTEPAAP
jgi:hypothetical protein